MEPIYTEYYERLKITANRILHNTASAEDAASDTIFKLIEFAKMHERPKIDNPGAYLYCAVRNTAIDMYNKNTIFEVLNDSNSIVPNQDEEELLDLERALKMLDETEFKITEMFYFYGYKTKEIALALDMPAGTVRWKLSKVRTVIINYFEKNKKY